MKKRGIRKSIINDLISGLVRSRKQALKNGASLPNTYVIKGRTNYYIYNKFGNDDAYITAVFYDGHFENKMIDFSFYNEFEN